MDAAWTGVVGAAVGGTIAVLGQWFIQLRVGREAIRAERQEAYLDFLIAANKGIRLAEELRSERMTNLDGLTPSQLASVQTAADKLRGEVDVFLLDMDRGLVSMQLASPADVRKAGGLLRDGIDECVRGEIPLDALRSRYGLFGALALMDLRYALGGGPASFLARRQLRRDEKRSPDGGGPK
jgi:hypothetical protein